MLINTQKGFTIIAIMLVVVVMTTLLAVLAPKIGQMRADNRTQSVANELGAALRQARSESLTRRTTLTFASLDSSDTTNPWGKGGWRLSDVATGNNIAQEATLPVYTTITSNPAVATMRFAGASGLVTNTDGSILDISFLVCDSQVTTELGHTVTLSRFGRIAVTRNTNTTACNP